MSELMTFKRVANLLGELADYFDAGDPEHGSLIDELGLARQLVESDPCLMGLKPGEPWFTLRGQDQLAPATIKFWIAIGENAGVRLPVTRVGLVAKIVQDMEAWPNRKLPD